MRFAEELVMPRLLLIALLFVPLPLAAQDSRAVENPLRDDPYWWFHQSAVARADAQRLLDGTHTPSEAIAAAFTIESKPAILRAAAGLLQAEPAELARGLRLLRERSHFFSDESTYVQAEMENFVEQVKRRVAEAPPGAVHEAWRESEYFDMWVNHAPSDEQARRRAAIVAAEGNSAGAFRELLIKILNDNVRDRELVLRRYRELAREHGYTTNGAQALSSLGFQLGHASLPVADPSDHLIEAFEIVKQLESGKYPPGDAVNRAASLIDDFHIGSEAKCRAANMPRLYAEYADFFRAHPQNEKLGWMLTNGVSRLGVDGPSRIAVVERFLRDLESALGAARVNLLRAGFYSYHSGRSDDPNEPVLIDPAEAARRERAALQAVTASADRSAAANAQATLATDALEAGKYDEARLAFRAIAKQFADADWVWVAEMRAADATEALGEFRNAAAAFEEIARKYARYPAVVAIARLSAGDVRETMGQLVAARDNHRAAMQSWPNVKEPILIQFMQDDTVVKPMPAHARYDDLTRAKQAARVDRLAAIEGPDGALLFQAQRAIENDLPHDAVKLLGGFRKAFPRSKFAGEAAVVLRRARFEAALFDLSTRKRPIEWIDREINTLAGDRFDAVTAAARMAKAALLIRRGDAPEARTLIAATLDRWQASQPPPSRPETTVDRDVAAIRSTLFLPRGGGVFGAGGWNGFRWSERPAPFILVHREVLVRIADGSESMRPITFATPAGDRVLFLAPEDHRALRLILDHIGGTETAEWVNVTDVPNQPISGALDIAQVWAAFFHVIPGHWGEWELTTYPDISKIIFDDETHARANVTIGYSGGTVILEKENGVWVAKRLERIWVT